MEQDVISNRIGVDGITHMERFYNGLDIMEQLRSIKQVQALTTHTETVQV